MRRRCNEQLVSWRFYGSVLRSVGYVTALWCWWVIKQGLYALFIVCSFTDLRMNNSSSVVFMDSCLFRQQGNMSILST